MRSKIFLNTQPSFYLEILTVSLQRFSFNSADGGIFHKNFGNIFFFPWHILCRRIGNQHSLFDLIPFTDTLTPNGV
jgi:hypothetical protein